MNISVSKQKNLLMSDQASESESLESLGSSFQDHLVNVSNITQRWDSFQFSDAYCWIYVFQFWWSVVESKSKSRFNWQPVGQSVLASNLCWGLWPDLFN
jgi:hypothetical protein